MLLSKEQALRETAELWLRMAYHARQGLAIGKWDIEGPWQDYSGCCPCCEYDFQQFIKSLDFKPILFHCQACPMKKQWLFYKTEENNLPPSISGNYCLELNSPYERWRRIFDQPEDYKGSTLLYDLEFFCRLISELAEEALLIELAKKEEL
jgi:hypothetical protein